MRSCWALVLLGCLTLACSRSERTPRPTPSNVAEVADASVVLLDEVDAGEPPPVAVYEPDPGGRPVPMLRTDTRSMRYVEMDSATCKEELVRREIRVQAAPPTAGVATPVWLRGKLHGVSFHLPLPPANREYNSAEIFDCRLLLALDDFSELLAEHDIVDVVHLSAYRSRNEYGCTKKYTGKQHCAALAVDVGSFRKRDGTVLKVEQDFHGHIGDSTCAGVATPKPATEKASELWTLVCEAATRGLFHVILTPNYNSQHKNHMHFELTPEANWMLIR